jgi:hypothetical protein
MIIRYADVRCYTLKGTANLINVFTKPFVGGLAQKWADYYEAYRCILTKHNLIP